MPEDPWIDQVSAGLREREQVPQGWRLGAPAPGAPPRGAPPPPPPEHDDPVERGVGRGWRPGAPPPGQTSVAPSWPGSAPPLESAPPAPSGGPNGGSPRSQTETSVRPLTGPLPPVRPQPGAPPGTPLPGAGWSKNPEPVSSWEPARRRRLRRPKPKTRQPARRPSRTAAQRIDVLQAIVNLVLAGVIIGVTVALIILPGPVHRTIFGTPSGVNAVEDRNIAGATLLTQGDLGSGWQPVARQIWPGPGATLTRPATTPSPVAGQAYADFQDCLGDAPQNADAIATATFRSGNSLMAGGVYMDRSRVAARSDLAVASNQQFVSCLTNELERSASGVAPGSSLIEQLHKPAFGNGAIAFRVEVGGNLFYDVFAVQQGRAVLFLQGIGTGRPPDLAMELNALQTMSARLPGSV
jgi:hypothetical protein